jgi:hypothetical protein
MPYTLKEFCADLSTILKSKREDGLSDIASKLSVLLANPAFVSETFSDDTPTGRRELWHDPETDVYVLAHVQEGAKVGKPHSHGASWAIYGTARGVTEMTEWRRGQRHRRRRRDTRKGQRICALAEPDPSLRERRDPFDGAPAKGLGDPGNRYRSRRHSALSLPP